MNNVVTSKVFIFRNVKDYKFTNKLTSDQKEEIFAKISKALNGKMAVLELNTVNAQILAMLKKQNVIKPNSFHAILFDEKTNTFITFFDGEHLTISSISNCWDNNLFTLVNTVAQTLNQKVSMSYSDKYGYLMSDITKIGTGIRLQADMVLPTLTQIGKIDQVKQNIKNLGFELKNQKRNNTYTLSTTCNLGYGENEIVSAFQKTVAQLQDLEIESAKMLDINNHEEIMDKYSRSMALLGAAYLMQPDELNNHISNLRLGLNLGFKDVSSKQIVALQTLADSANPEFISKSELMQIATQAKNIIKGA